MKVFIVMRNDQVDQVFFNTDPAIARAAAEARARELTAKWARGYCARAWSCAC